MFFVYLLKSFCLFLSLSLSLCLSVSPSLSLSLISSKNQLFISVHSRTQDFPKVCETWRSYELYSGMLAYVKKVGDFNLVFLFRLVVLPRLEGPVCLIVHITEKKRGGFVSSLLYIYIYIYIYMCVCVCVCVCVCDKISGKMDKSGTCKGLSVSNS